MVQIREGAWYRRRDGKIVGPAIRNTKSEGSYPWVLSGGDYTETGSWVLSDKPLPPDLIEEVPAPDAAPRTPSAPVPGFPGDLRDWFAGQVLTVFHMDAPSLERLMSGAKPQHNLVARFCYDAADAMMAQRNKEKAE